jgi:hypothetical protein
MKEAFSVQLPPQIYLSKELPSENSSEIPSALRSKLEYLI